MTIKSNSLPNAMNKVDRLGIAARESSDEKSFAQIFCGAACNILTDEEFEKCLKTAQIGTEILRSKKKTIRSRMAKIYQDVSVLLNYENGPSMVVTVQVPEADPEKAEQIANDVLCERVTKPVSSELIDTEEVLRDN